MKINRIIFFGTPDFSVETLKALIEDGFDVVAVVTVPDKPAGRGLKMKESEVKLFAISKGISVLQPDNLNSTEFHKQLIDLKPDVQIVVAFKKLPSAIFSIPPLGTINLHASLLPYYRGAAPINWAIINGENETGVTTFIINEKIDEGHILLQEKVEILKNDTAGTLYDKLKTIGAKLLVRTLHKISEGELKGIPQENNLCLPVKKAPKIQKTDCRIRWDFNGEKIKNFIRGLSPYPGAFTELMAPDGTKYLLKIYTVEFERFKTKKESGLIETDGKTFLKVVVSDGLVSLLNIQLTGKVCMDISSFLRGFQVNSEFRVSLS